MFARFGQTEPAQPSSVPSPKSLGLRCDQNGPSAALPNRRCSQRDLNTLHLADLRRELAWRIRVFRREILGRRCSRQESTNRGFELIARHLRGRWPGGALPLQDPSQGAIQRAYRHRATRKGTTARHRTSAIPPPNRFGANAILRRRRVKNKSSWTPRVPRRSGNRATFLDSVLPQDVASNPTDE